MTNDEAIEAIEKFHRCRTTIENFDNLTIIGNRDEINDNEHRLKHFQVKLSGIFKDNIITFRVSIVQDTFFCCVVTRYNKSTFVTDKNFVDKLISGEEPVTDKLIALLQGDNNDNGCNYLTDRSR